MTPDSEAFVFDSVPFIPVLESVRCGRNLRGGNSSCSAYRRRISTYDLLPGTSLLATPACDWHMTPVEKAAASRLREDAERAYEERRAKTVPACWTWSIPTYPVADVPADEMWQAFADWHQDRCAICGLRDWNLVQDHDHYTMRLRGRLCQGCNVSEGQNNAAVFMKYRVRNPASILCVDIPYWDPFGKGSDMDRLDDGTPEWLERLAQPGQVVGRHVLQEATS